MKMILQGEFDGIKIVEITDENRKAMLDLAISGYIGEKCKYCEHVFESVEDIAKRNVVWAGSLQYACKECFDKKSSSNLLKWNEF